MKKLNEVIKEVDKFYTTCYVATVVRVPGLTNFIDLDRTNADVQDVVTSGCETYIIVSFSSYLKMMIECANKIMERYKNEKFKEQKDE